VSTKQIMTAIAAGAALLAGAAHAETVNQDIQLRATVPSGEFYVKAVNGWPAGVVSLNWDDVNNKLQDPTPIALRLKNNLQTGAEGKINASLAYDAALSDGTAAEDLPVEVSVSSESVTTPVVLSTTSQMIYDNKTGNQENGLLKLHVKQDSVQAKTGTTYNGVVSMIFESAV
jgi:hypothetical protein